MPTALITGPTAGLGRAYAKEFAARGFDLVLVSRDEKRLREVGAELTKAQGVECEVLPADLADLDDVRKVEKRLADNDKPIHALVNNAGFGLGQGFLHSDVEDEQRLMDVLVRAVMRLTKAVVPGMLERKTGAVINVASVAGFLPFGTYGAAKAWVITFSEAVAAEVAGSGVRVLAVCPGYVHTEFHERGGIDMDAIPSFLWLEDKAIIKGTFRHLDQGKKGAVVVPSARYRSIVALARHAPRRLMIQGSRSFRRSGH